jgi:hypothetical protein
MKRHVVLLLALCTIHASAQVAVRKLTPGELVIAKGKIAESLILGLAGSVQIDRAQAFAVSGGAGFSSLWIEPVRYESHNPGAESTSFRCGLFLIPATGPSAFLQTLGYNWTEPESCDSLMGVGFVAASGAPRILLLYAASTPHANAKEPFVLDWNVEKKQYDFNEKLSSSVAGAVSIASMKRRLKVITHAPQG